MTRIIASTAIIALFLAIPAAQAGVKKDCASDISRLCGTTTDKHAIKECLKSNMPKLSPTCSTAMANKGNKASKSAGQ